jgi:hypothetical protein
MILDRGAHRRERTSAISRSYGEGVGSLSAGTRRLGKVGVVSRWIRHDGDTACGPRAAGEARGRASLTPWPGGGDLSKKRFWTGVGGRAIVAVGFLLIVAGRKGRSGCGMEAKASVMSEQG